MNASPRSTHVRAGALVPFACALLLGVASPAAHACSFAPGDFLPSANANGSEPPGLGVPEVLGVSVRRGRPPVCGADGCSSSTCDDIGTVAVELAPEAARDPRVGYEIALVAGSPPDGIGQFPMLLSPSGDGLKLRWIDGATDDQDLIDFSVSVTEIDAFGNRGPASMEVRVLDDGEPEAGASGNSGGGAFWWVTPLALLSLRASRRRCRSRRV